MPQFTRQTTPLGPEQEIHPPPPPPPPPAASSRVNDSAGPEVPPTYNLDGEGPLFSGLGSTANDLGQTDLNNQDDPSLDFDENPTLLNLDKDPTLDSNEDPPPSDYDSSDDDLPPPESDSDEDEPSPGSDSEEDDPEITLENMKIDLKFIRLVEKATLESQFTAAELHALRNPQESLSSPSDDPDLWLSIRFFISSLDHRQSQKAYSESRLDIQEHFPEAQMLSYDRVKRQVSDLSGLVTWKHDMCVDSCVGFTGPFADLEDCPRCHKPRYDEEKLRKSNGKDKVP